MRELREQHLVGREYLGAVTALLQRRRATHSTKGTFEAAEIQWWWSIPRSTDSVPQLFWFDADGRPEAAVTLNDFGDGTSAVYEAPTLVVIVMPEATADWVSHVVERGLAHFAGLGIGAVELEADRADEALRNTLFSRGFTVKGDGIIECWLDAQARPEVSALDENYRLCSRKDTMQHPHHMAGPGRPDVEQRLRQTSLYRPDLDLVVLDRDENPAAYGLFWYDPVTTTGVVEPMRTLDGHQRRGLARHLLTAGVDLLADAGAERISIGFEPENPASRHLYLSVGFEPHGRTDVLAGTTSSATSSSSSSSSSSP